MADMVLIVGEGGTPLVHDLPLPEFLAARVAANEVRVLGPCDEDGNLLVEDAPEPVPAEPVKDETSPSLRFEDRTQDTAGQSADDDGPAAPVVKKPRVPRQRTAPAVESAPEGD